MTVFGPLTLNLLDLAEEYGGGPLFAESQLGVSRRTLQRYLKGLEMMGIRLVRMPIKPRRYGFAGDYFYFSRQERSWLGKTLVARYWDRYLIEPSPGYLSLVRAAPGDYGATHAIRHPRHVALDAIRDDVEASRWS